MKLVKETKKNKTVKFNKEDLKNIVNFFAEQEQEALYYKCNSANQYKSIEKLIEFSDPKKRLKLK